MIVAKPRSPAGPGSNPSTSWMVFSSLLGFESHPLRHSPLVSKALRGILIPSPLIGPLPSEAYPSLSALWCHRCQSSQIARPNRNSKRRSNFARSSCGGSMAKTLPLTPRTQLGPPERNCGLDQRDNRHDKENVGDRCARSREEVVTHSTTPNASVFVAGWN